MGINPARSAAIRVLGSGCFSHFGVLALERNTKLNLRRRPKQVYWSREQFGKIGRHALSREDFGQRQPKSDWYSRAWDTWAGESTSRFWLFDQLKFPGR